MTLYELRSIIDGLPDKMEINLNAETGDLELGNTIKVKHAKYVTDDETFTWETPEWHTEKILIKKPEEEF